MHVLWSSGRAGLTCRMSIETLRRACGKALQASGFAAIVAAGILLIGLFALPFFLTTAAAWQNDFRDRAAPVQPAAGSKLANLARLLTVEDELVQWGFATIVVDELALFYETQLESSYRSRGSSAARRARLARWQRATQGYVDSLYALRMRLDEGEPLTLFVDHQSQVVIGAGEQLVLVGGPGSVITAEIERRVVDEFCGYNDCQWLGLRSSASGGFPSQDYGRSAGRGIWTSRQVGPARYELGERFAFEFEGNGGRDDKALVSDQAVDELDYLADEFAQLRREGYPIEWDRIALALDSIRADQVLVLNSAGDYFDLNLPLLTRLREADWQRVVSWLSRGADGRLVIEQAGSLLVQ